MEFSAVIFGDCVGLSRHFMLNHSHIPATLSALARSASAVLPIDSSASSRSAVRSDPFRPPSAVPRALVRRVRRIRRRSATEDDGEDDFFDGGDGDDGPFGGGSGSGSGSGSGKGWGSWRPTGSEWEEPDRRPWLSSSADSAFDVIYEVEPAGGGKGETYVNQIGFAYLLNSESPNLVPNGDPVFLN